jgi:hypothetical protein
VQRKCIGIEVTTNFLTHTHACELENVHTHMHACDTHTHACENTHTHACENVHIHIRMHAKMCTYTYACMRKCARMHANTVHYRPAGRWHKDSSSRARPLASIEWGVTSHNFCVEVSDEWLNLCAHYSRPRTHVCENKHACMRKCACECACENV